MRAAYAFSDLKPLGHSPLSSIPVLNPPALTPYFPVTCLFLMCYLTLA